MYIPSSPNPSSQPALAPSNPLGELGSPEGPELQLFGRDGFVAPQPAEARDPVGDDGSGRKQTFLLLLVVAALTAALRAMAVFVGASNLPDTVAGQSLLVAQWATGALLVIPVGLCVYHVAGRVGPAVFAGLVCGLHPGVLSATLSTDGTFWSLAAVSVALFFLFGGERDPADGSRPVPGVSACAAAGLALGAGGLLALPAVVLAAPLALWRFFGGLGCTGPGRGLRDVVAAIVLVAAAAIPTASHLATTGNSPLVDRLEAPHGEVLPRLIEHRWPTLLSQLGLSAGLNLTEEILDAFSGPPSESAVALSAPTPTAREPGLVDAAVGHAWTGLNAFLLCGAIAGAGLALHRKRKALGLLMLLSLPLAVWAGGVSGEQLRLALLPLQLLLLGVFGLPPRRFRRVSAVFTDHVKDAGFAIKQNTARVI